MKTIFLSLLTLAAGAQAAPIRTTVTATATITTIHQVGSHCIPGIPSNGHNFPTPSVLELTALTALMPELDNTLAISHFDSRTGDTCAAIYAEVNSQLPAEIRIERTLIEEVRPRNGVCVRRIGETVRAELANKKFWGSREMILETRPPSECRPTTF